MTIVDLPIKRRKGTAWQSWRLSGLVSPPDEAASSSFSRRLPDPAYSFDDDDEDGEETEQEREAQDVALSNPSRSSASQCSQTVVDGGTFFANAGNDNAVNKNAANDDPPKPSFLTRSANSVALSSSSQIQRRRRRRSSLSVSNTCEATPSRLQRLALPTGTAMTNNADKHNIQQDDMPPSLSLRAESALTAAVTGHSNGAASPSVVTIPQSTPTLETPRPDIDSSTLGFATTSNLMVHGSMFAARLAAVSQEDNGVPCQHDHVPPASNLPVTSIDQSQNVLDAQASDPSTSETNQPTPLTSPTDNGNENLLKLLQPVTMESDIPLHSLLAIRWKGLIGALWEARVKEQKGNGCFQVQWLYDGSIDHVNVATCQVFWMKTPTGDNQSIHTNAAIQTGTQLCIRCGQGQYREATVTQLGLSSHRIYYHAEGKNVRISNWDNLDFWVLPRVQEEEVETDNTGRATRQSRRRRRGM